MSMHEQTNAELEQALRTAIEWGVYVDARRVHVGVRDGVVTIDGDVDLSCQREQIERLASRLPGARAVHNRLRVVSHPIVDNVQAAIAGALERHAAREAAHIGVRLRNGVVEISGVVGSAAEKRIVLGAAKDAAGATPLDEHVAVST